MNNTNNNVNSTFPKTQKKIIIAEKPSVGKTYANILGVTQMKDGYMESDAWIVTWSVGHLIELSYPEAYDPALKKWAMETLPFLPERYKYNVISSARKQFNVVKSLYNRSDIETIYYAGDSGREGLYIQMLIRMAAGHKKGVEEKVVWIDSQTKETVLNGIRDAKPLSAYNNLTSAGYMRGIEDYSLGINFSRILSLLYGAKINAEVGTAKYTPVAVGRVMTCVLGMIVAREIEIKDFVSTTFYKIANQIEVDGNVIKGEWKVTDKSLMKNSPKLYGDNGFLSKEDAQSFIQSLPSEIRIANVDTTIEKKNAPLLFNLAELQAECSKKFKIRPAQTLEIAQSLYEKKLTTYPRTDARVLSSAIAKEIGKNLEGLQADPVIGKYAADILTNNWHDNIQHKKYVNDSKITDHYAIIPTGQPAAAETLSDLEKKVYELIARRFLAIFYPVAEYSKLTVRENADLETFSFSGKTLRSIGYLKVYGMDEVTDLDNISNLDRLLKVGDTYKSTYSIGKGQTTPPKRYTSGTMVLAMENAGNLIEDASLREQIQGCGIGTPATRDETIEKLIRLKYIAVDDKSQVLTPDKIGYLVYDVVKEEIPSLLYPKMTASWEKGLHEIETGTITQQQYRDEFEKYIRKQISTIKEKHTDYTPEKPQAKTLPVNCPVCGNPIVATKYGYKCSNYDKETGCSFSVGEICGKRLTEKQMCDLIQNRKTAEIKGFKSKNGKSFNAALILESTNKISFDFSSGGTDGSQHKLTCGCGADLITDKWSYHCDSCGIRIPKTLCGLLITENTVKELLSKGYTRTISGFKSKNGKVFKAKLKLENGETKFDFGK